MYNPPFRPIVYAKEKRKRKRRAGRIIRKRKKVGRWRKRLVVNVSLAIRLFLLIIPPFVIAFAPTTFLSFPHTIAHYFRYLFPFCENKGMGDMCVAQ